MAKVEDIRRPRSGRDRQQTGGREDQASSRGAERDEARQEPAIPSPARPRDRAVLRQEQERAGVHPVTGGTRSPQGISNHDINEERARQAKVVPIRNEGKTSRRRKVG